MKIERFDTDGIDVGERLRPLSMERVNSLVSSIREIGLRTPLTVIARPDGDDTKVILVTGHHRLAALRELGEDRVDCFVIADDEIDAKLWEIAENLHRADLSKEQRDHHIRLYAELLAKKQDLDKTAQPAQFFQGAGPGRGHKSIASKVAEQVGLSRDTVKRALNPPSATANADQARRAKLDGDVKDRATREAAEIIAQYVPADAWDGLKANLYASGAKHLADMLTNILGNSVMDRGGWH